ncbi:MAG: hypothetical protein JSW65_03025, partial [Candidatus Bipolaricaulota bacterium]
MRRRRRMLLAVAFLALAVLLVTTGCDDGDHPWGDPQVRAEKVESAAFDAVEGLVLDLESSNGTLRVLGDDEATEVVVTATLRTRGRTEDEAAERLARVTYTVRRVEERIEVRYRGADQDDDVRRFSGIDFDVTTPPEVRVLARASNGAISVERTRGNVTADTSNGAVDLYDVEGDLLLETSNGRLAAVGVVGEIRGRTSNGEVWLDDVRGAVDVETSNGGVYYTGVPSGEGNALRTSNGSITVRIPADAA